MNYGLPTYPIHSGMILGHREPDELQWLIEHGVFQTDLYNYMKITKISDTDYRLVKCKDSRYNADEETVCGANSLMTLIEMAHIKIDYWHWYGSQG